MSDLLYVVRYTGPFGFIKPWTAVRDAETFSQPFLTPSILEGLCQKLGVSAIVTHRLSHAGLSRQQEQTQARAWAKAQDKSLAKGSMRFNRARGILVRGVMLRPHLHLAFATAEEAARAAEQHVCLCRNEDVLLPGTVEEMSPEAFADIPGFTFEASDAPEALLVGYNRFVRDDEGRPLPMRGFVHAVGQPVHTESLDA
ncbi:MAG: hypothetical protein IAE99_00310 [Rhodothermales bacterium]|nr:hypothetical protein [Rhodothermales bacterium]